MFNTNPFREHRATVDAVEEVLGEKKKLDPVDKDELKGTHADREDGDIDNDGDEDDADKFLHKKRKAISKSMKKKNEKDEVVMNPKVDDDKSAPVEAKESRIRKSLRSVLEGSREEHNKGAIPAQDAKENRKGKGAEEMMKPADDAIANPALDEPDRIKKDAAKMTSNVKVAKGRPQDKKGEGKIIQGGTPMKDPAATRVKEAIEIIETILEANHDVADQIVNELSTDMLDRYARLAKADIKAKKAKASIAKTGAEKSAAPMAAKVKKHDDEMKRLKVGPQRDWPRDDHPNYAKHDKAWKARDKAETELDKHLSDAGKKIDALNTKAGERSVHRDLAKAKSAYKKSGPFQRKDVLATKPEFDRNPSGPRKKNEQVVYNPAESTRNIAAAYNSMYANKDYHRNLDEGMFARMKSNKEEHISDLEDAAIHHSYVNSLHMEKEKMLKGHKGDPDDFKTPEHENSHYLHSIATDLHQDAHDAIRAFQDHQSKKKDHEIASHRKINKWGAVSGEDLDHKGRKLHKAAQEASAAANMASRRSGQRDRFLQKDFAKQDKGNKGNTHQDLKSAIRAEVDDVTSGRTSGHHLSI